MKRKVLLTFLLMISITIIPINSFATEKVQNQVYTISLTDAYSRALTATNDLNKNDKSIYDLIKPYGAAEIIHNRSPFNMENEFNKLYEKLQNGKFLQSYEQGELVMYYAVFKDSDIFQNKSLSPTINPNEFPNCEVWVSMMQMKINNELLRINVIDSVRKLYDSLLSINENVDIVVEYTKVLELEYKEASYNFKNGKISELEMTEKENNYEIQKLELNKLNRSKSNIERNLKRVLGIDFKDDIQIVPYIVLEKDIVIPGYESCIKEALFNRNEIALAKMSLLSTQIQLPILDDYILYMPKSEGVKMSKQEALFRIEELKLEIKEQEELVRRDINTKYGDIDYQKKTIAIQKLNLQTAQKDLDKAKLQYKSGEVSYKTLTNVKIAYEKSKVSYESALRELANEVTKLDNSCGVG